MIDYHLLLLQVVDTQHNCVRDSTSLHSNKPCEKSAGQTQPGKWKRYCAVGTAAWNKWWTDGACKSKQLPLENQESSRLEGATLLPRALPGDQRSAIPPPNLCIIFPAKSWYAEVYEVWISKGKHTPPSTPFPTVAGIIKYKSTTWLFFSVFQNTNHTLWLNQMSDKYEILQTIKKGKVIILGCPTLCPPRNITSEIKEVLVYLIIWPISSNRKFNWKYLHGTYKQSCCVIDIINRDLGVLNFNINNKSLAKGNKKITELSKYLDHKYQYSKSSQVLTLEPISGFCCEVLASMKLQN